MDLGRPRTPFRHDPPRPADDRLLRPRLLEVLAARFEHRVTVLQAGAGFGKSTLLAQALAQNRLDPRGVDVWLSCARGDADAEHLADGLAAALGITTDRATLDVLSAALWRLTPRQVAVVLDDVHLVAAGSSGARLLVDLAERLPRNGHLVLATREGPPVAASSSAAHLGEAALAFDGPELASFATNRSVPVEQVVGSGGWPAIAELRAGAGADVADAFLWEEVVTALEPQRRSALTRLLVFGGFDDELVALVADVDLSARDLAAGLPLADVDPDTGSVRLHDLWPRLVRQLHPDDRLLAGARLLERRGELRRAFDVLGLLGAGDAQVGLLDRLAATDLPDVPVEDLRHLIEAAPPAFRSGPSGDLLRGEVLLKEDGEGARAALRRAAAAFAATGDTDGEVRALTRRLWLDAWGLDSASMREALARLRVLAERGSDRARRSVGLSAAYVALIAGDPEKALVTVTGCGALEDPVTAPLGAFVAAVANLESGRPEEAASIAADGLPAATGRLRVGLAAIAFESRVMAGLPDSPTMRQWMEQLTATANRYGVAENQGAVFAGLATLCTEYGWLDEARDHLDAARDVAEGVGRRLVPALTMAEVAVHLAEGDEAAARKRLGQGLAVVPLTATPDRAYLRSIVSAYVLEPSTRPVYDDLDLGPTWMEGRALAQALAAVRDADDPSAVRGIDWSDVGRLRALLPGPFVVEAAVAAVAAGEPEAAAALDELPFDVRPSLRRLVADGAPCLREPARDVLVGLPTPPSSTLEVRVLGPLELWRDGQPVVDRDWSRERVRSLLLLLVDRRRVARRRAAVELWPDLDEQAAADNLRVNLNHLLRVLQPDRRADEPSWFVAVEDDDLVLRDTPQLVVDVDGFRASMAAARAAEEALDPAAAVEHYRAALARHRGDYLVDAPEDHWGEFDRTRMRGEVVHAALRAGELLAAAGQPEEAARLGARAVAVDPFVDAAHRLCASAMHQAGDRAGAWRLLSDAVGMYESEGLTPEPQTLRLLESLRST